MTRSFALFVVALGLVAASGCTKPEPAAKPMEATAAPATDSATPAAKTADGQKSCAEIRECTDCPNDVFIPTDCWTTQYGPARANVVQAKQGETAVQSPNMLYCNGGAYALCFFSGPEQATGKDPSTNPKLPCTLDASGDFALCRCQAYTNGAYFVDIHGIGNLRVYYQTVDVCGPDGKKCRNISNCGTDGTKEGCLNYADPPVCSYVQNQQPGNNQVSLIPGAEMISTFSFAMNDDYKLGTTECPNTDKFPYAGCMTAPCNFVGEKPAGPYTGNPIECKCPTWNGPYQIGQTMEASACVPPKGQHGETYIWSASYTVQVSNPAS